MDGISQRGPGFVYRSDHVVFVVDKVALGQVFLRVLQFLPVNNILPWLSIRMYQWGMNARPVDGRSSETVSSLRHKQQQQYS
jgi:hypothetical protein